MGDPEDGRRHGPSSASGGHAAGVTGGSAGPQKASYMGVSEIRDVPYFEVLIIRILLFRVLH